MNQQHSRLNRLISKISILFLFLLITMQTTAQYNYESGNVEIIRDEWGVPHIFGKTDADAAYGFAWAHAEDDFYHIQLNLLAAKGMLGRYKGPDGALFDFMRKVLFIDTLVAARYETDLSPEFRAVLDGYAAAINDYAAANRNEVLIRRAFPVTGEDVIQGYVLTTTLMAGVGFALNSVLENRIRQFHQPNVEGSNAVAIAPHRTADNQTYMLSNSHQPMEGRFAWYEAHIQSEEGWDIIGGAFPGGATIFLGTNHHLSWAHTVNYHNFGDIYKLKTNSKDSHYEFDGEWVEFEKKRFWLRVKVIGIPIPVRRTVLYSEFGPVIETDHGFYALRYPAHTDIRSGEQWYRMNKATNLEEFEAALRLDALPLFNVVYGDVEGNILFHSAGLIPDRDTLLDWTQPITASTSEYKWNELLDFDQKPTLINPDCGFVFNSNQTPLHASGWDCNWTEYFVGLQLFENNRGEVFGQLLNDHEGDFTWEDFNRIKFDKSYKMDGLYMRNFGALYTLDETDYPEIADAIQKLKNWDLKGNVDNKDAALALVIHDYLVKKYNVPFGMLLVWDQQISEEHAVEAIHYAKNFLEEKHGSMDIPLGQVQRHIRGDVSIPASGLSEVNRAADAVLYDEEKGIFRVEKGDTYIQMVKLSPDGIKLYTVNAYGASSRPESPHFTDQMEMFQNEEFKEMTFDKEIIRSEAAHIYKPCDVR